MGGYDAEGSEDLKPGDKVMMSGPYGDFHPNFTSGKEMIWIGGGAGMAPLRAQIMHMTKTLHTTDRELHFFYGARALGEAFFLEDFWELEKEFPNFHFHLSLDRKDPVANGNVYNTDWIDQAVDNGALTTSHSLAFTGGSKTSTYSISGGYTGQDGLIGGGE